MPRRNTARNVMKRRVVVARLYCQGVPQFKIARRFLLTQQQISLDIKAIKDEWQRSMLHDFDQLRAEQLAKIDAVEEAAWLGWRRSMRKNEVKRAKVRTGPPAPPVPGVVPAAPAVISQEQERIEEEASGNPAFLAVIVRCAERRCKLMGWDAPERKELAGPGGTPIPVTIDPYPERSNDDIIRHIDRLRESRLAGRTGVGADPSGS